MIFSLSALGKLTNYGPTSEAMGGQGVPAPTLLLASAILFLLAGSVLVVLGYQARIGAALLLVFLVLATYFFHDFWAQTTPEAQQAEMIQFLKNAALMGAMLLVIANGSGGWSLDNLRTKSNVDA